MEILKINNGSINEVFFMKINDKKYVMRASNFSNDFECKILNLLSNYKINSPILINKFKLERKNIMICEYIDGEHPKKIDNVFLKILTDEISKLHNVKQNFSESEYKSNNESILKLKKYYTNAIKSKYLKDDVCLIDEVLNEIEDIDFKLLPQCIIHSDLKEENILVNNDKIYLIDFGNTYIGNRLIDLIRVIMWFFIKNNNWNFDSINFFLSYYFQKNCNILEVEKEYITPLIKYCILYNLLKDVSLYEEKILESNYIENNSLIWLRALKDKEKLLKIGEVFKNA